MSFVSRHIGNLAKFTNVKDMLRTIGVKSFNEMMDKTGIHQNKKFCDGSLLHNQLGEYEAQSILKSTLNKNKSHKSFLGYGYYDVETPAPIKRHILENPQWYTAYTPYQAEISQGRLESQYNFQTIIKDLTGLPVANASLLDEASSAGEALNLSHGFYRKRRTKFLVDEDLHPQTLEVLNTRANILDLDMVVAPLADTFKALETEYDPDEICNIIFQYPNTYGNIKIPYNHLSFAKENKILTTGITDLLALTQIVTPGELGLNIALGNCQRFGIPMWYGGPHPAFFATSNNLLRYKPGRIIGKSRDSQGNDAYRLALQTREQHIKRENATSNICTSQSLLTNVVSFYAIYHGREGIREISESVNNKVKYFIKRYNNMFGCDDIIGNTFFDTVSLRMDNADRCIKILKEKDILVRKINDTNIGITFSENMTYDDVENLFVNLRYYNQYIRFRSGKAKDHIICQYTIPSEIKRQTTYLTDSLFSKYRTETELLRYMNHLASKDYTLCNGMIPLGSCTMKLNATYQLEPLSWSNTQKVHPFVPLEYAKGYQELINKTGDQLKEITGFNHVNFQPNSGATGEYAGLLCIKKYHQVNGNLDRNICLIPKSAHGTNFASASVANMKVETFDDALLKDHDKFKEYIKKYDGKIACMMITYPNTNGVFQDNISEVINIVHEVGGLVYMDGANMNALVGFFDPAEAGFDVCHLNLHKTFCIPHGGGGPGLGPILCNDKLAPFLPSNIVQDPVYDWNGTCGSIASSNWSSASLLTIPNLYISTMGIDGLRKATMMAILNSNYLRKSLEEEYNIIDVNKEGFVGHEFIIDVGEFKEYGITENDIAKRLIDYSFHPPTMSWPRSGVLMFEPTESESKEELDRLIEAMLAIKCEIKKIMNGVYDPVNNPLKNAPHTITMVNDWNYPYSIKEGLYPVDSLLERKFMPPVGRVDDIYGDKQMLEKSKG
jgi:glycine dehydrogenase